MNDLFHSAALKLTGWYLMIIMLLSIGTSLALYHVSSGDLSRNTHRQVGFFNNYLAPGDFDTFTQLRQTQLDQDLGHLRGNLLIFNLGVLIIGGAASYALARRTLRPIEESLESQKRFAGDASHELRTPLTAMQTEIEVALRNRGITKDEAVGLLQSNLEEVAKLKALSEGLLQLSSTDGIEDLDQAVSLKDVTNQAIERLDKVALGRKIKINSTVKEIAVRGNHQHLVDLFAILLDNALKYSPRGSQVKISSSAKDKTAIVSVIDEGEGIAPADLPNIFERFYRADSSRSKLQTNGYGLGLAIAKKITDLHGGSIEVKSAPQKGSTFSVHLPRA
jgi:signal transduction histidine kinase